MSSSEKSIRIAYLLLVHKNPEQVNMFIKQLLDYGDCDIYIHVDKKNETICEDILKHDRVVVCSEYNVRWGSFEICKAALRLMKLAQERDNGYTHFYFGSGQDLLVKNGLYDHLANNPENIFLRINREVKNKDRASSRYRVNWPKKLMIRNDMHIYRFIRIGIQLLCKMGIVLFRNKKKLSEDIKFYEGRTWFIAPKAVLEYILDYIDKHTDYKDFWENSLASDLMFFQTIIMNSSFADKVKDELMYVRFGKTFRTSNHPLTVQISDNEIIESGNYYCARKFETSEPQTIEFYIQKTMGDRSDA